MHGQAVHPVVGELPRHAELNRERIIIFTFMTCIVLCFMFYVVRSPSGNEPRRTRQEVDKERSRLEYRDRVKDPHIPASLRVSPHVFAP